MLNETQLNGILLDQNNSVVRLFVVTQHMEYVVKVIDRCVFKQVKLQDTLPLFLM